MNYYVEVTSEKVWHDDDLLGIDLGGITLKHEGKEFMLDTSSRDSVSETRQTIVWKVTTDMEELKDVFPDCKFNLDINSMSQKLDKAEIYISFEDSTGQMVTEDLKSIQLVRVGIDRTLINELTIE